MKAFGVLNPADDRLKKLNIAQFLWLYFNLAEDEKLNARLHGFEFKDKAMKNGTAESYEMDEEAMQNSMQELKNNAA